MIPVTSGEFFKPLLKFHLDLILVGTSEISLDLMTGHARYVHPGFEGWASGTVQQLIIGTGKWGIWSLGVYTCMYHIS